MCSRSRMPLLVRNALMTEIATIIEQWSQEVPCLWMRSVRLLQEKGTLQWLVGTECCSIIA